MGEHSRLEDGCSGKKASEEEGSCWSGGTSRWLTQGQKWTRLGVPAGGWPRGSASVHVHV